MNGTVYNLTSKCVSCALNLKVDKCYYCRVLKLVLYCDSLRISERLLFVIYQDI